MHASMTLTYWAKVGDTESSRNNANIGQDLAT
jgi:hypothetical protein